MGLLGSIVDFGSNLVSNIFNRKNVKDTNRANQELAKQNAETEYQHNLEMWNRTNEYNSPAAQMSRLKEAGLNPNLAYGSLSEGNAKSMPNYQIDHATQQPYQMIPFQLGNVLQTYQNIRQSQAAIENTNAQTRMSETKRQTEVLDQMLRRLQGAKNLEELRAARMANFIQAETMQSDIDSKRLSVQQAQETIANLIQSRKLSDAQIKNLMASAMLSQTDKIIKDAQYDHFWKTGNNPSWQPIEQVKGDVYNEIKSLFGAGQKDDVKHLFSINDDTESTDKPYTLQVGTYEYRQYSRMNYDKKKEFFKKLLDDGYDSIKILNRFAER